MRLFLLDNQKITTYNLPEEVSEMFLFSYNSIKNNNESLISIEASDGKWKIKSNGSINVIEQNTPVASLILEDYKLYTLQIIEENYFVLLCALPNKENNEKEISLYDISNTIKTNEIKIGSDNNSNIIYNSPFLKNQSISILFENNGWYIVSPKDIMVYLNKTRVEKARLAMGDIIFIYGLKIVWMNNFFRINNPLNSININGLNYYQSPNYGLNNEYSFEQVTDVEKQINESDYFFHTPTIKPVLEKATVKIDSPPPDATTEDLPFVLTIGSSLTMASSSFISTYSIYNNVANNGKSFSDCLPQIIMSVSMIIGSLIMPLIIRFYQKHRVKSRERKRQRKYKKYLSVKEEEINKIIERQSIILCQNNPSIADLNKFILSNNRLDIWSREIEDSDFLNIRLGVGETNALLEIKAPEETFTLDDDNLIDAVHEIVNKSRKLSNVPVILNLVNKRISTIITTCDYTDAYINSIFLQLMTHHSGSDLKLVIFGNEDANRKWSYLKSLPHCWSDDKSVRFFATNTEEYNSLDLYLSNEFKRRKEILKSSKDEDDEDFNSSLGYKNFSPYYLIINDNYKKTRNLPIITSVLNATENNGFSMLILDKSMLNIPKKVQSLVIVTNVDGCVSGKEVESATQDKFMPEYSYELDMSLLSEKLSNIPLLGKDAAMSLPNMLSFLEMYNVTKIEQLNISNRWKENDPTLSLSTPIGVHTNGDLFKLDLHEKFHGPHGLIAGSTGSGKSEFIITFLLSMAINYHPYEVQFVLIDYKGGGLAGAFENKERNIKVPHLAGTITNLDKSEINRTLVSIQSELKRRQRVFNKVKDALGESTMDIYKYQRFYRDGVIEEPVSHLFIVSDEFAELKSQQPEFMDELISTARIGRSLGVHLILATQKPTGVVNDQIWSNSKFKVCLKVQDRSDSMEMLKKPDAASIKETGRFYLQVGYDDYYDIGQSAWAGAKYIPSDTVIKKIDDSIVFVNNVGNTLKSINNVIKIDKQVEEKGDQLTNIVKYLYDIGVKQNIVTKQMWLNNIPEEIYINDLIKKYDYKVAPYQIKPIIGEYDNPEGQEQGLLTLDLTNVGNTLILGMAGSGKANLLTTLIVSICTSHSPEEVNIYIIDYGSETLKIFGKYPHVGSIVTADSGQLLLDTLVKLEDESERRKELFVDYGGNYINYINESGNKLPLMILIINNYEIFAENNSKLTDAMTGLIRDGFKYGIVFIFTSAVNNAIRGNLMQLFINKISLQQSDSMNYRNVLNSKKGLEPKKYFGRGIIANDSGGYEFQTALISEKKNINATIRGLSEELNNKYPNGVQKVITMPNIINVNLLQNNISNISKVPIGYGLDTKECYYYDFYNKQNSLILCKKIVDNATFIEAFSILLSKSVNNMVVFDCNDILSNIKTDNMRIFISEFNSLLDSLSAEMYKENTNVKLLLIIGFTTIYDSLDDISREKLRDLLVKVKQLKYSRIIIIDEVSKFEKINTETWSKSVLDNNNGIWLGNEFYLQTVLKFRNVDMETKKSNYENMGVVCDNSKAILVKLAVNQEE